MVKFKRHGKYVSERLKPPAYFDKRSFRTVKRGEHIVTVGCRFGKWDTRRKVCLIGVEAQRILHQNKARRDAGLLAFRKSVSGSRLYVIRRTTEAARHILSGAGSASTGTGD